MCPRRRPPFTRSLLCQHKLVGNHGPQWGKEKLPGSFLFRAFRRHTQAGIFRAILGACLVIGLLQSLPWNNSDRESLSEETPLEQLALEGETTKLRRVPPPTPEQLDRDKLELDEFELDSCTPRGQLERALAAMHQAVRSLSAKLGGQEPTNDDDNNTNDNNNNNHTNNNNNNTTTTTTTTTMSPTTTTTTTKAVESLA